MAVPANAVTPNTHVTFQYSSLAGYWKFEEGCGTLEADSSGNQLTGTLVNSPAWVQGRVGQYALDFNGANQRVNVDNPAALQITGPMTLAAWVWVDSISGNGRIASKQGIPPCRGWSLNVESYSAWNFQVASSPTTLTSLAVANVGLGSWVHLAGVYDSNNASGPTMKLYINGVLGGTLTDGVPASQSDSGLNVSIGA